MIRSGSTLIFRQTKAFYMDFVLFLTAFVILMLFTLLMFRFFGYAKKYVSNGSFSMSFFTINTYSWDVIYPSFIFINRLAFRQGYFIISLSFVIVPSWLCSAVLINLPPTVLMEASQCLSTDHPLTSSLLHS